MDCRALNINGISSDEVEAQGLLLSHHRQVLSLKDDDHWSMLSSVLQHLNIGIVALSEVRRLDSCEIMVGGDNYYWTGRSDDYHAQGVAVAVSNKLTPMIIEVTPFNENIM